MSKRGRSSSIPGRKLPKKLRKNVQAKVRVAHVKSKRPPLPTPKALKPTMRRGRAKAVHGMHPRPSPETAADAVPPATETLPAEMDSSSPPPASSSAPAPIVALSPIPPLVAAPIGLAVAPPAPPEPELAPPELAPAPDSESVPALLSSDPIPPVQVLDDGSQSKPPFLFEIGWEVCWQLGGIYTVLRTKAPAMMQRWGENYCLVGPYNPATAAVEFEERPATGLIKQAMDRLRQRGVNCHYGRWLITGRPQVILLEHRARFHRLHEDKYLLWKDHGISTPPDDGEVNEVVAFGFAVAEWFGAVSEVAAGAPLLAHFHEWMGGVAVPRLAHLGLPVSTIFTTHATLLGRYLAGDDPQFYQHLPFYNADADAEKYRILPRHLIEKAAAHASVVFTTVSEVTAVEAEKLLGRRPDAILPNGINTKRFAALHEFQNLHRQYKEVIHEFVQGHFFPSYSFDLDRTLYLFTSGRYEYRNKGIDLFVEALARLNGRLRQIADPPTIVAFIITRAPTRNINVDTLRQQAMFDEMRTVCTEQEQRMGQRLLQALATGHVPGLTELLRDDEVVRLKRLMHAWRSGRQPTIVTHDLWDDRNDPTLNHLRDCRLLNAADDPVKVVFHPEFVTATSPLIALDYEQFVRGCHMGIFPSYYEPWGYTPMEAVALGVPAVTTDLSGFGAYVNHQVEGAREQGILVLNRRNRGFDQTCDELVQHLLDFIAFNRRQRIELRNRVERLSELFDWTVLISHYHEAHDLALERCGGKRMGRFELRIV